jgi:transcriptional regulator GlxA family with amidase domain
MQRILVEILRPENCLESCIASWRDMFTLADRLRGSAGIPPRWRVVETPDSRAKPRGNAKGPRILLLPSLWGLPEPEECGIWAPLLRNRRKEGFLIGSVCAGAFFLAEAGLLSRLTATTHWSLAEEFRRRYPRIRLYADEMLIDHGAIILGAGTTAYFDLGLRLLERFEGAATAAHCSRVLLVEPARRRQSVYSEIVTKKSGDDILDRACAWLDSRWATRFTLGQWASGIGVEKRTLHRRFKVFKGMSPWGAVVRRRLEEARVLLETGTEPWEKITERCAYEDPVSFGRSFRKLFGVGPRDYRARFTLVPLPRIRASASRGWSPEARPGCPRPRSFHPSGQ